MHKVLSRLPFEKEHTKASLSELFDTWIQKGLLYPEERERISLESILKLTNHSLYARMKEAWVQGGLYREKPFVLGLREDENLRMIQGIIDVCFLEDGEWVLIDYKTDSENKAQVLKERYETQLEYYEKALVESTGCLVKEKYIYSLFLNEIIEV